MGPGGPVGACPYKNADSLWLHLRGACRTSRPFAWAAHWTAPVLLRERSTVRGREVASDPVSEVARTLHLSADQQRRMSAVVHFADSSRTSREVREVPIADIAKKKPRCPMNSAVRRGEPYC